MRFDVFIIKTLMEIILFKCFCCVSVVHSTIINQFNVLFPLVVMIPKLSALWDDQFYSLQDQKFFLFFLFPASAKYIPFWWKTDDVLTQALEDTLPIYCVVDISSESTTQTFHLKWFIWRYARKLNQTTVYHDGGQPPCIANR